MCDFQFSQSNFPIFIYFILLTFTQVLWLLRSFYHIMTFLFFREDVWTVNVIAAGEVTCLVMDRE